MTATIKKLHQGLDNVDFIGTENIISSLQIVGWRWHNVEVAIKP